MQDFGMAGYKAGLFDGPPSLAWLQKGWRGLRLYGRKARMAMLAGDAAGKAAMIARADELLNIMTGILETGAGKTLGPALLTIYTALRFTLLQAGAGDDVKALDDFDAALAILDRDMMGPLENGRTQSELAA